jgi:hypothetical protein
LRFEVHNLCYYFLAAHSTVRGLFVFSRILKSHAETIPKAFGTA